MIEEVITIPCRYSGGKKNRGNFEWYEREMFALLPTPEMSVSEWADERRILQPGTSRQPGPWSTDVTPYLKEPMDAYNDPDMRHIVLCFGTQLGKTECLYNILGFIVDLEAYSTLLLYPIEDDAKEISRTRLQPMIEACESLDQKRSKSREFYQQLEMHFPGMVLYLGGASSGSALSQKAVRNLLRDEVDLYPARIGDEGNPIALSEERTKSFWDIRKIVDVSSPTVENWGILKQMEATDEVRKYYVPCPHCGRFQTLEWEQIEFDSSGEGIEKIGRGKRSARYRCVKCKKWIGDGEKMGMLEKGEWKAERKSKYRSESVSYWLWSLYSPFLTWGDIVETFLKAVRKRDEEGDIDALKEFTNKWLARPWKVAVERPEEGLILSRKCDLEPMKVPEKAVALTAGVDVQKHGFWFTIWAWTREMESWLIHYGFLAEWEDVENVILDAEYEKENGEKMQVWRAAMDTGGTEGEEWTKTEEIYTWIRRNGRRVVSGIKGMSRNTTGVRMKHTVLDKMPNGKPIPGGLIIWLLDTNQLKDTFFWRLLENDDLGAQPVHLHREVGKDYVKHLLAEEKQRDRQGRWLWVKVARDNHLLDASVYAHACADIQWMGGVRIFVPPGGNGGKRERKKSKEKERRW